MADPALGSTGNTEPESVSSMGSQVAPPTLECPECFAEVELQPGTLSNEVLQCPECGFDLEVRCHDGVWRLDPAPEVVEDVGE